MVVYRATPPDVASGVRVGDVEYPGYPARAGVRRDRSRSRSSRCSTIRISTRASQAFARDEAGNEAKATFVDNVFEKPFKKSRIELDDKFINRVVPEILEHAPELKMTAPPQAATCCRRF